MEIFSRYFVATEVKVFSGSSKVLGVVSGAYRFWSLYRFSSDVSSPTAEDIFCSVVELLDVSDSGLVYIEQ